MPISHGSVPFLSDRETITGFVARIERGGTVFSYPLAGASSLSLAGVQLHGLLGELFPDGDYRVLGMEPCADLGEWLAAEWRGAVVEEPKDSLSTE